MKRKAQKEDNRKENALIGANLLYGSASCWYAEVNETRKEKSDQNEKKIVKNGSWKRVFIDRSKSAVCCGQELLVPAC